MITTHQIRQRFLDFFARKGHQVVPSAPLIPQNDPTLLFVNAGMVPFKDVFLGTDKRPCQRATSVQRCVRAGGKHNDLENVGYTARHHTFFEMLGNFSFGDYFKRDAIAYAWEFLTEVINLPPEKLWITVYEKDDEADEIWLKDIGVDPQRFSSIGEKDNFWSMGDTGPCGPCTEIFYDHGEHILGSPPGTPDEDGDRYVEIWNLVFMQYNRSADGQLTPLPKPSVDTGMGIERLAAVLQGVHDNFDTDGFVYLIKAAAALIGIEDLSKRGLRVIADHIRACAFLIADGVLPANEGRGYVLRRIMRRAIRYGHQLGMREPFFYQLVEPLTELMGEAYPELVAQQYDIRSAIRQEEQQFAKTLDQGMRILNEAMVGLSGQQIAGDIVFKLYDTYGFPVDLTSDVARENGLSIDQMGFEACMAEQRERARAASQFNVDYTQRVNLDCSTTFTGYTQLQDEAGIQVLLHEAETVETLQAGVSGDVVLAQTPFYAESGGQVADQGELVLGDAVFVVEDVQKQAEAFVHYGVLQSGNLTVGDRVQARVNVSKRRQSAANHSATHLLHAALRQVVGQQVTQKGSLVAPDRLRFDISLNQALPWETLREVEDLVNAQIQANHVVRTEVMTPEAAQKRGAMALFGEKYGSEVRVLSMGDFSIELCGGTHVARTGDIGLFKILSELGIAAGVRRIEAITGPVAVDWTQSADQICIAVSEILNTSREQFANKLQQVFIKQKQLEKTVDQLKAQLAGAQLHDILAQAQDIAGTAVIATEVKGVDAKGARHLLDQLKQKLGSGVVVLAVVSDGKVNLVAGVTADLTKRFHAGKLVGFLAEQFGGRGGGRPDMAQAGGNQPEHLTQALASITEWMNHAQ